jgi:hypothetical protein
MIITGLTTKQIEMLDIMWNIPDALELELWKLSLSKSDHTLAVALQELLIVNYIDEVVTTSSLEEANEVINKLK